MKTLMFVLITFSMFVSTGFAANSGVSSALVITDDGLEMHATDTKGGSSATSPMIGKCSTGVGIGWVTDTAGYALATQHKSGSKAYATSFDSTSLFSKDVTKIGDTEVGTAWKNTDTTDFKTWDEL